LQKQKETNKLVSFFYAFSAVYQECFAGCYVVQVFDMTASLLECNYFKTS
jgi:hypothetical protein